MRLPIILAAAALTAVFIPNPVSAEARESYLERLRMICEPGCLGPRDLLRSVRKRGGGADQDVAAVINVAAVSVWNGKYMLHSGQGDQAFDTALGSQTPLQSRPVTGPDTVVVEMDEATFFDLLNVPTPQEQAAMRAKAGREGGIIVERDRSRNFTKPTLNSLRSMFRNRSIVVRGQPRLEAVFVGARKDYRRKKVFIALDGASDLVFLPRYDRNGEPILDGPLEGLREAYQPAGQ